MRAWVVTAGVLVAAALAGALAHSGTPGPILLLEIRDTINPATASYLEGGIHRAESSGASLVVVELDTPGGLLASVKSMAEAVSASAVPVVVYTSPAGASATSAGALLTFSAHVAAMAPGTHIGAAHPVDANGKAEEGPAGDKAVNDTAAFARGLAEVRGRNVDLAAEVVSKSRSFTAPEAVEKKVVDLLAEDRGALLRSLDGRKVRTRSGDVILHTQGAEIEVLEMSVGQRLMSWLAHPNVAAILMTLGMLLIYVEVSHPGISVAGVTGAACLIVAFMAFQVLPIRAGGVVFLGLGLLLLVLEAFAVSGGWLAAAGVISFVLGLLWFVDPTQTDITVSAAVWLPAGLTLAFVATVVTVAAARMRRLSKELRARIGGGGEWGVQGYEGRVETPVPAGGRGKAQFRGEIWTVESHQALKAGQAVKVIGVKGFTLRVEPVQSEDENK